MFNLKLKTFLFSATLFTSSLSIAQAMTLSESVKVAVTHHPEVLIAHENKKAIYQAWRGAESGFYPTVNVLLATGHERSNNPTTRGRNANEEHRSLWRNEARLTVDQMLFDGFETDAETCEQRYRFESAKFHLKEIQENIALRAVDAYLAVLRAQELLTLQKENVQIHKDYLSQMEKRASTGRGSQADVRQAQGRLSLAKANLLAAQGKYRSAKIDFNEVIGESPTNLSFADIPVKALPKNVDIALENAFKNNPALRSAAADISAADKALDVAKSAFYPRVNLELSAARQHNLDGSEDMNNEYQAMTRMRYNLYNGGADTARKNERKARLEEAKKMQEKDHRRIEENVYTAWNDLHTARLRLTPLSAHVTSSNQTRSAYKKQFEIGNRSLLDVLDSEVEYVNAKSARIIGQYAVELGVYTLLAQEGTLVETLILENTPKSKTEK